MSWAPVALMVAGSLYSGMANRNAAKFNEGVAQSNAAMTRSQGEAAAQARRRDVERQLGQIRAGYAASGVSMEGSPLDVFASSAVEGELDVANTRYNYEMRARGYDAEATSNRMRARTAILGAVLGGAGQAAGSSAGQNLIGSWSAPSKPTGWVSQG